MAAIMPQQISQSHLRGRLTHASAFQRPACLPTTRMARCQSHKSDVAGVHAPSIADACRSGLVAAAAAVVLLSAGPSDAMSQKVGEFTASGFLFKDSVELTALEDPDVTGVTVYVSDFKRSIVDKLAKDFFSEPSQASISCAVTGPVNFRLDKIAGSEGHEMFSESKGFNLFKNKTLRIRRTYDANHNTMIYTAYSTRLSNAADDGNVSSGRYKTSLCALKLPDPVVEVTPAAAAAADN